MKKLIQMIKNLPPELRMFLAMAGLASPIGVIYLLQRFLFPGTPLLYLILGVAVVVGVLCLIGFVIARLFGRGKRKRARKMAADLADESASGPVGMDVAAAIKANNDKYFNAIRDMRKNIGVSVYDLPWYIVIGDSGCGKTKLVNEGGLQFPTGKPEGYQLGTLNYNWWFTEDAVFVDMAGRLCNPQVDEDRREWEAFLSTIGRGRKGYPINGAIVCVSADHLLQDPPEKIEQDANTTLERLRDLQTRLGVTFATYLVLTKCDKIVGFMQFFDRAERDITVLNQMVGWSKPGEFTEPNDPERFNEEFDTLYRRLNELRLRRINDDVDEVDIGLAYSFPEEFRELRAPLNTYVRTLFPMIKNPRAIKNLLFRGVYFTSATREGSLILKHITERLGPEVADQFAPLDLYPSKRPYFIKDLLFRKVFPEHGLVFRNEQQAVRNRKLARLLKYGSAAVAVLLFGMLWLSSAKFGDIIDDPRKHAQDTKAYEPPPARQALQTAGLLHEDISKLGRNRFWAGILSLGWGTSKPVRNLETIQAALFERVMLRQALIDVSEALRTTELPEPGGGDEAQRIGREYMDALKAYITWFGCLDASSPFDRVSFDSFDALCRVVKDRPESPIISGGTEFRAHAKRYFATIRERGDWPNPARLLRTTGVSPTDTISAALATAHKYLGGYAGLNPNHPDADIREWMRIQAACAQVDADYGSILAAASEEPATLEDLEGFKERFVASYDSLASSLDAAKWRSADLRVTIRPLREAILEQRRHWLSYQSELEEAYSLCESPADPGVVRAIEALSRGDRAAHVRGLDELLWDSLREARLTDSNFNPTYFDPELFAQAVREVYEPYGHIITFESGGQTESDRLLLTPAAGAVRSVLEQMWRSLGAAKFTPPADPGTPGEWIAQLDDLLARAEEEPESALSLEGVTEAWRPRDLARLYDTHEDLVARGQGRRLLLTVREGLAQTGAWGLAHVFPDAFERMGSEYRIMPPVTVDERDVRRAARDRPRDEDQPAPERKRRQPRRERGRDRTRERPAARESAVLIQGEGQIPKCAKRSFLFARAEECADLLYNLRDFGTDLFLASDEDGKDLNRLCMERVQEEGERYMRTYVEAWGEAYEGKSLETLQALADRAGDWSSLAGMMRPRSDRKERGRNEVSDELERALGEILASVPFWGCWYDERAGEWLPETEGDPDWLEVVVWMQSAINDRWPVALGRFVSDARPAYGELPQASRGDAPWDALAGGFAQHWEALAKAIAANAAIPRAFEAPPSKRDLEQRRIPWGKIETLRREARLDGERLTQQLLDFEAKAHVLLSAELTNILCGIQSKYFARESPLDGWPYLRDDGAGAAALKTVDFEAFKQFLREVGYAYAHFTPLEEDLPDTGDLRQARVAFYRGCREWHDFLDLNDQLVASELAVSVDGEDPLSVSSGKVQVDDTAQFYYDSVELDLALELQKEGTWSRFPLLIATDVEVRAQTPLMPTRWGWSRDLGDRGLVVRLVDGQQPDWARQRFAGLDARLGDASPLAFCAYLHRYGSGSAREWITTHSFDLPQGLQEKGQGDLARKVRETGKTWVGQSFRFKLARPMPEPIRKLEPGAPSTSTGP